MPELFDRIISVADPRQVFGERRCSLLVERPEERARMLTVREVPSVRRPPEKTLEEDPTAGDRKRLIVCALLPSIEGTALITIGRTDRCDVTLPDLTVSKEHARMDIVQRWIEDAGSSNGTKINGRRLIANERAQVSLGDDLTFGSLFMRLQEVSDAWEHVRRWARGEGWPVVGG